jgi:hypothetical protein
MRWIKRGKASEPIPPLQGSLEDAGDPKDAPGDRRVIRTARTLETINQAARHGFRPLVKPVDPNPDVHFMMAVFQNSETGEIELSGDVRFSPKARQVEVIDYMIYYPYAFPNPFAAYLIPPDLKRGEIVWLEDVIEDIVAIWGNQGYQPRLEAAPARWTGADFVILFHAERDAPRWIG